MNGVKMSIVLCLIFVCLYRANLAAHGTQNVVDISSIDNWLGTTHNLLTFWHWSFTFNSNKLPT
jgi:hypothetical protein